MFQNLKDILDAKVATLTKEETEFLIEFGNEPILRKFLSSEKIKMCNLLHKKGFMNKGKMDIEKGTMFYQVESFVYSRL